VPLQRTMQNLLLLLNQSGKVGKCLHSLHYYYYYVEITITGLSLQHTQKVTSVFVIEELQQTYVALVELVNVTTDECPLVCCDG